LPGALPAEAPRHRTAAAARPAPDSGGLERNRFLKPGDGTRLTVTGPGEQRQKAVADPG